MALFGVAVFMFPADCFVFELAFYVPLLSVLFWSWLLCVPSWMFCFEVGVFMFPVDCFVLELAYLWS